ncbi:RNA polymerase-associated protein CTR9 [Caenorhabditis elegans]|uniref:Isoform d of RNA polymerase-associated protein CTR9 n=1 Tax=Caenorhabditis elegans TaxID=6239 RepID=Q03560-4|nr:RNA polymerase-associated protein CTR9 [Caenorhabditis elegans]CAX51623.1 RNA polymerase-associated protein CTR9 [Caenorhabditis elegans]|eukprot:NP_001255001.1 RNA polymerase-associated protein CTR9 [Caenorhabditis elegans]
MDESIDDVQETRTIAIPLKDSHEDGTHLKRLRRFSIEVWNLMQNWATASEKSVQYLESLVNSRLKLLYSREVDVEESAKLTKDQSDRVLNEIVVMNSKLNQTMSDFEKVIGKFEVAQGRMSAWKQLTEKSQNIEEKYIVETLDENLPLIITMLKKELKVKQDVLFDFAQNDSRDVFTLVLLTFKHEPFVDVALLSKLFALVASEAQ